MRYDTQVKFWDDSQKRYNPRTHTYDSAKVVDVCMCNVTDLGVEKQVQLLGDVKQSGKTVRMAMPPASHWTYLTVGSSPTIYRLVSAETVSKGYSIVVGEDANGTKD
jgi:hypothetical protein